MAKKVRKKKEVKFFKLLKSNSFQRIIVLTLTWLILSTIVAYEAAPVKYKLEVGDISQYDIQAPRDIENTIRTRQNAEEKASKLAPVIIDIENANSDMLNGAYEYFEGLEKLISDIKMDTEYQTLNEKIQEYDQEGAYEVLFELDEPILRLMLAEQDEESLQNLKNTVIKTIIPELTKKKLMEDNLAIEISRGLNL